LIDYRVGEREAAAGAFLIQMLGLARVIDIGAIRRDPCLDFIRMEKEILSTREKGR
jgi:hypothetical protein